MGFDKRLNKIRAMVKDMGVDATAEIEGVTRETIRRYCRHSSRIEGEKETDIEALEDNNILKKIAEKYSKKELQMLARGGIPMEASRKHVHNFSGEVVKIGYLSDTHIGSIYTDDSYIAIAREEFAKENVDMVVHAGDVCEGMSNRAGHIYECSELGYDAQKEQAIRLLSQFDFCPLYMVDGNHDRWYIKSNGAIIVKDICKEIPDAEFLGHDEGDIEIGGVIIKAWHGLDSSSYAISYRLQKLIESFTGGEKPDILIAGHVHKYGAFFIRHVHCIGAGCVQKQSKWMRGKRIAAHTGFGIIEVTINENGVGKLTNTFFPFYA